MTQASRPTPVAVVGAGSFGRHHARVYSELPEATLVAVVDRDLGRARQVAEEYGCEAMNTLDGLAGRVLAASVAVPTDHHATVGVQLMEAGIDVLVEKPIAADVASATSLVGVAERHGRILQIGHLERFNPVVDAAAAMATVPLFFEVHRLSPFSPRSLDVDVVLDLMIHDLDLLLSLVDSEISQVDASGLSVISNRTDIANARLQFENGCVANLTASRVSTERIRKLRFFQPREYVSVDYVDRKGVRISLVPDKKLQITPLRVIDGEPLLRQLRSFLACVVNRSEPRVKGIDGQKALGLALKIREAIGQHSVVVSNTLSARKQLGTKGQRGTVPPA